jgi:hypothetical protein
VRLLQVSPTLGQHCGVAVFADSLAAELSPLGIHVTTIGELATPVDADLVVLQYHEELMGEPEIRAFRASVACPLVLVAHSSGIGGLLDVIDGVMSMSPGIIPVAATPPTLVFPHPCWTPERLSDRDATRARFGLRQSRTIGTCGFLRFERQLVEMLSALLPHAVELGWSVQLTTSPWRIDSPGVIEGIRSLDRRYPGTLAWVHEHLPTEELNLRLQACDLLWCWTRAPSMAYASGVASQQYASGTRIVAADKQQHEHILVLPNVVRAPVVLDDFAAEVVKQMRHADGCRHDPSVISWERQARKVAQFLRLVAHSRSSGRSAIIGLSQ